MNLTLISENHNIIENKEQKLNILETLEINKQKSLLLNDQLDVN